MEQLIIKYHRVSSVGQSIERQRIATDEYIANKYPNAICKTYEDEQSGKNFNRKNYLEMKQFILEYKAINPNAEIIIVVKELDRFGRNMQMIKEEWDYWKKVKVYINVVDTEILNTNGKSDLETELIGNIVLDLLSYFAENERLKNNRRQREGYDALKKNEEGKLIGKNGEVVGRRKTTIDTIPNDFKKEYEKFKNGDYGKMTNLKFAEMMGIKKTTFYKYAKIMEGK